MTKRTLKRFLIRFVLAVVAIKLFLVLVVTGGVLYLRSPSGEAFLSRLLVEGVESAGFRLSIDEFQGPVPERLMVRGLRLEDAKGIWLTVDRLELDLALSALWSWRVEVNTLAVDKLQIIRSPEENVTDERRAPDTSSMPFRLPFLPFSIAVNALSVHDATLGEAILGHSVGFDVSGALALRGGQASGQLHAATTDGAFGKFGAELTLEEATTAEKARLALSVAAIPGEALPEEIRLALGDGFHLSLRMSGPSDLSLRGTYALDMLDAGTNDWSLKTRTLTFSREIDGIDLSGIIDLALYNPAALKPIIDLPMESAQLHSTVNFSVLDRHAMVSVNGIVRAVKGTQDFVSTFDWGGRAGWRDQEALPYIDSTVDVAAQGIPWPSQGLDTLLGTDLTTRLTLSGGSGQYALVVDSLKAGDNRAFGRADLVLDPAVLTAAHDDLLRHARLNARFTVNMDEAGRAVEAAGMTMPLSTPLSAVMTVEGDIDALKASLALSSPQIQADSETFSDVKVSLDASINKMIVDAGRFFDASGTVSITSSRAFDAPFSLAFGWDASPQKVSLHQLEAKGVGVTLQGDLDADLVVPDRPLLGGSVTGQVDDWKKLAGMAGLEMEARSGLFSLKFSATEGRQDIRADVTVDSFSAQLESEKRLSAAKMVAQADLRDVFGERQTTVRVAAEGGEAGIVRWAVAEAALLGDARNGDFTFTLSQPRGAIAPNGNVLRPSASLGGTYRLDASEVILKRLTLDLPQRNIQLRLRDMTRIVFAQGLSVDGVRVDLNRGGLISGRVAFDAGRSDLDLSVQNLPLSLFDLVAGETLPEGRINATARLRSENNTPVGTLSLSATARVVHLATPQDVSLRLDGNLRNARLSGKGTVATMAAREGKKAGSGGRASVQPVRLSFDLPVQVTPQGIPSPDMQAPFSAEATWRGAVAELWAFVPLADRSLTGDGSLKLSASGTLTAPRADVSASLKHGRYNDRVQGVLLTDMTLNARQSRDGLVEGTFSAADGRGGKLSFQMRLNDLLTGHPTLNVQGSAQALAPLHRDDLSVTLSGPFSLEGPLSALRVGATITVDQGELRLLRSLGAGVRTLTVIDARDLDKAATAPKNRVDLDIRVIVPNRFFVRGRGLDSEWRGNLHVGGTAATPLLTGALSPVRGQFEILSRTFVFSEGSITFLGNDPPDPDLDLSLTYSSNQLSAIIKVAGAPSHPVLTLESQPSRPEDEIMAAILFGKSFSDLSRFEVLQVANGLRVLAGVGESGFDPLMTMRRTLGIDVLRLGGGGAGGSSGSSRSGEGAGAQGSDADAFSLEAGKYVLDNVYVGVEQRSSGGPPGVRVEIELLPNLTVEGRSNATSTEVGTGWKRDY